MLPVSSGRENQILKLITDELTHRDVSCILSINELTVENHIHHVYSKLGIPNRAQAVSQAFQLRIIML